MLTLVVNNLIDDPGSAAIHYGLQLGEWGKYPWVVGQIAIVGNVMNHGPDTRTGLALFSTPLEALRGIEEWLDGFEHSHPELRVARLRPHWVIGPHSFSLLARLLRGRLTPRLAQPLPLLQCVHEQDVAEAIVQALRGSARGAFNLAGDEATTLQDMHRRRRWLRLRATPARVARRLDTGGGCMELLRHPLLLDTRRARDELGWRPRRAGMAEILAGM